jgi:hypothetical protein
MAVMSSALAAVALAAGTPAAFVQAALPGSQSFSATGSNQTFTVPSGVIAVVVDLFGARGGTSVVESPPPHANGGETTGTLSTTPGQAIEVVVGSHGANGTANGAGAGGFNGGGDGSTDADGCCPGGAGGGGATDVRTGACTSAQSCDAAKRVLVAGGGGGAGGGANAGEAGGAGGGTTGVAGSDVASAATGGGGGTQTSPGSGGTGTSAGTQGDTPSVGDGGPGGGVGGGGGGGWHGGGGGASDATPNGAGGGGGSSFAGASPSHLTQGNSTASADGSAAIYWLTWTPASPTAGQLVTLTSHLGAAAAGGTETFKDGSTTLCSSVTVASDGTAECSATLASGSHTVTATYTDQPSPGQAQFDGLFETSVILVSAATPIATASPAATPAVSAPSTGSAPTKGSELIAALMIFVGSCVALAAAVPHRRRQ